VIINEGETIVLIFNKKSWPNRRDDNKHSKLKIHICTFTNLIYIKEKEV
jgi:hypothetical protein